MFLDVSEHLEKAKFKAKANAYMHNSYTHVSAVDVLKSFQLTYYVFLM